MSARSVDKDGRARAPRDHGGGGVWWYWHGVFGACGRDGGGQPRFSLSGFVLWCPFELMYQSDQPQRHSRTEAALPAETDQRRAFGGVGDERVGRWFRCRKHARPSRSRRRSLSAQWYENVDH